MFMMMQSKAFLVMHCSAARPEASRCRRDLVDALLHREGGVDERKDSIVDELQEEEERPAAVVDIHARPEPVQHPLACQAHQSLAVLPVAKAYVRLVQLESRASRVILRQQGA